MSRLRVDLIELDRARAASGITSDYDLARRLGLNRSSVSRIIRGQMEPGATFIKAALEVLPTNFDALFVIEQEPTGVVA